MALKFWLERGSFSVFAAGFMVERALAPELTSSS
jgi:hypothetical protein